MKKLTEKKLARIVEKLNADAEIVKHCKKDEYATPEHLAEDLHRFVEATKEGRLLCSIQSVSKSGMSRVLQFLEMARYSQPLNDGRKYHLFTFYRLFRALGYTAVNDGFRVNGCGMDMVFATHYNIIHDAFRFGVITKAQCYKLAQMTPNRI